MLSMCFACFFLLLLYEHEQDFVGQGEKLTIPQYYLAGSLAAIPISVVESPVDLFKIQLQAQVLHTLHMYVYIIWYCLNSACVMYAI
jgi:hypothetical protein